MMKMMMMMMMMTMMMMITMTVCVADEADNVYGDDVMMMMMMMMVVMMMTKASCDIGMAHCCSNLSPCMAHKFCHKKVRYIGVVPASSKFYLWVALGWVTKRLLHCKYPVDNGKGS